MTDTTVTAAPGAPAEVPASSPEPQAPAQDAPKATEAPTPIPAREPTPAERIKSMAEARQHGRQGAREAAERRLAEAQASREKATEKPRDAQGRFVAPETPGEEGTPVPHEPAPVGQDPESASGAAKPEATTVPEGWVTIELPEGHPWRQDRGQSRVHCPPEMEQVFRTTINQAVRTREYQDLKRLATELQGEVSYWKAQFKPQVDEALIAHMEQDILKTYGPVLGEERAKAMVEAAKDRLLNGDASGAEQARRQAVMEAEASAAVERGHSFMRAVEQDAILGADGRPPRLPGWSRDDLAKAFRVYGNILRTEGRDNPTPEEFYKTVAFPLYLQSPAGQRFGKAASEKLIEGRITEERRKATEEAERKRQDELREAAQRHRSAPRIPASAAIAARAISPEPAKTDTSKMPLGQLKNHLRTQARALGGGR